MATVKQIECSHVENGAMPIFQYYICTKLVHHKRILVLCRKCSAELFGEIIAVIVEATLRRIFAK